MSPVPLPFCKGQSHPCHRQVREKKGGTGARWCCWAGGRICSRYPAPGRGGAVHCRRKRTGFAQLSAFCFSPLPHSDGRDAWEAPTSSALPAAAAAPFCGGLHQHPSSAQCCVTRRRHHVCLLPTGHLAFVTGRWQAGHWTVSGSADTDTASRLKSAIPFRHCPVDSRGPIQLGSKTASRLAWAGRSAIHPQQ